MKPYKKAIVWLSIIGSTLLGSPSFSQNKTQIKNTANSELLTNFNQHTIVHDSIIKMDIKDILKIYGQEKWLELIKEHILIEINILREKEWLPPLIRNTILDSLANADVHYMDENNWYNHNDKNWVWPDQKVTQSGYKKSFMGNIIHHGPRIISLFIEDLKKSPIHYVIATHERGKDIGIWYVNWYRTLYIWWVRPVWL